MSVFAESVRPAPLRDRSTEARRAARQAKARRERRIVDLLNRGVWVAEIAAREEVTEKRMRSVVSEILARRMPEPPAEFLALQVSRLSEALLVAYSAMSGANLRAVDRVVKIVRELDRYHGFSGAEVASSATRPKSNMRIASRSLRAQVARKRPRKFLKRLKSCPEMAWPRTRRMRRRRKCLRRSIRRQPIARKWRRKRLNLNSAVSGFLV